MRSFLCTKAFVAVTLGILVVSLLCVCACEIDPGSDQLSDNSSQYAMQTISTDNCDISATGTVEEIPVVTQDIMSTPHTTVAVTEVESYLNNTPGIIEYDPIPSVSPESTPDIIESTPAPTATNLPDPIVEMIWFDDSASVYYDMDFDGEMEQIEIVLTPLNSYEFTCSVNVTLGATGEKLTNTFTTEFFSRALLNNYNSGDGRAELLICCGSGAVDFDIYCYRLNADSSAIDVYCTQGWIESADENTVTVGRYIDILGTWACTSRFSFDTSVFELYQYEPEWNIFSDEDRWCTASGELPVQFYLQNSNENYEGFLYEGDSIRPLATDMNSYVLFVMEDGRQGLISIIVDPSDGSLLIYGLHPTEWFFDLAYI